MICFINPGKMLPKDILCQIKCHRMELNVLKQQCPTFFAPRTLSDNIFMEWPLRYGGYMQQNKIILPTQKL